MATAYHGSSALFDRFDPSHLLGGDGKFKFGVGAYLTSRYTTAAHYSGATSSPDHYVYTVQIPDLTPDNHLRSLSPVHPDILRRISERLGVEIPAEAATSGKFFRKWLGNLLSGNAGTVKKMIGSASLEAEKAASAFLPTVGVVLLAWPTAQTKPEAARRHPIPGVPEGVAPPLSYLRYLLQGVLGPSDALPFRIQLPAIKIQILAGKDLKTSVASLLIFVFVFFQHLFLAWTTGE